MKWLYAILAIGAAAVLGYILFGGKNNGGGATGGGGGGGGTSSFVPGSVSGGNSKYTDLTVADNRAALALGGLVSGALSGFFTGGPIGAFVGGIGGTLAGTKKGEAEKKAAIQKALAELYIAGDQHAKLSVSTDPVMRKYMLDNYGITVEEPRKATAAEIAAAGGIEFMLSQIGKKINS